jgi:hypothetical protein
MREAAHRPGRSSRRPARRSARGTRPALRRRSFEGSAAVDARPRFNAGTLIGGGEVPPLLGLLAPIDARPLVLARSPFEPRHRSVGRADVRHDSPADIRHRRVVVEHRLRCTTHREEEDAMPGPLGMWIGRHTLRIHVPDQGRHSPFGYISLALRARNGAAEFRSPTSPRALVRGGGTACRGRTSSRSGAPARGFRWDLYLGDSGSLEKLIDDPERVRAVLAVDTRYRIGAGGSDDEPRMRRPGRGAPAALVTIRVRRGLGTGRALRGSPPSSRSAEDHHH